MPQRCPPLCRLRHLLNTRGGVLIRLSPVRVKPGPLQ
jgi:hypothetical protein